MHAGVTVCKSGRKSYNLFNMPPPWFERHGQHRWSSQKLSLFSGHLCCSVVLRHEDLAVALRSSSRSSSRDMPPYQGSLTSSTLKGWYYVWFSICLSCPRRDISKTKDPRLQCNVCLWVVCDAHDASSCVNWHQHPGQVHVVG